MTTRRNLRPAFSVSGHDRDSATRENPERLEAARNDPDALVIVLFRGSVLTAAGGSEAGEHPSIEFLRLAQAHHTVPATVPSDAQDFFLGRLRTNGVPVFARVLHASPPEHLSFTHSRELAHILSPEHAGLLAQALAVSEWHARYAFSPTTGRPTETHQGGWMRQDPESGEQFFPRTDPAVIVLVRDRDDRILLGSNVLWEVGRYSLLAGFVEAGESLEDAVIREVFEESGIRVVNPVYRASQPWPFPRSLMLGFEATIAPDQDPAATIPDGEEIVDLRWVSREDLLADPPLLMLPGESSIARSLINDWLNEKA